MTFTAAERGRIREANDRLRQTFQGGRVLMTSGIQILGVDQVDAVLQAVRTHTVFNDDNDPHGEHDYGGFDCGGTRFFWKIDYYDEQLAYWKCPLDSGCQRVLTIGRMDEY